MYSRWKRGKVSILTENSERIDNVSTVQSCFNNFIFPQSSKELGSIIFWIKIPKYNIPVIVGVLNKTNEIIPIEEGEFYIGRIGKEHKISIIGQEQYGSLFISLDSGSEINSNFEINLSSKNKNSLFQVISDGNIVFNSKSLKSQVSESIEFVVKEQQNDKYLRFENNTFVNKISLEKGDNIILFKINGVKDRDWAYLSRAIGDVYGVPINGVEMKPISK